MKRLKEAILGNSRWNGLMFYITLVDSNRDSNPNASLDGAKSILESIAKTILTDKGLEYKSDESIGSLVKKAFSSLPVFMRLNSMDAEQSKAILNAFATISNSIGSFRNNHGFFAHGHDLQSEKFDRYLVELSISSSDLLAGFLIVSHSEGFKDRSRLFYEENEEFNNFIDKTTDSYPSVMGIPLLPSKALFSDAEAYKDALISFIDKKTALIEKLTGSTDFVSTRSVCRELLMLKNYLVQSELKIVVAAAINNPQVYRILGHGFTRGLYKWILTEKSDLLSADEINDLKVAFTKKMY